MAERKYGRLYTDRDVERIISEALIRQHTQNQVSKLDTVLEHIDAAELTFPADEPLFLLRGQDVAAPGAIEPDGPGDEDLSYYERAYRARYAAGLLEAHGEHDDPHLLAIKAAAQEMREWQAANPDRVKAPD